MTRLSSAITLGSKLCLRLVKDLILSLNFLVTYQRGYCLASLNKLAEIMNEA